MRTVDAPKRHVHAEIRAPGDRGRTGTNPFARRRVVEALAAQFNKASEGTAVHPLKAAAHPGRLREPLPYHSLKHEARHEVGDGPIAELAVDELTLGVLPSADVLDLRNEIHRLTRVVAHQRDG